MESVAEYAWFVLSKTKSVIVPKYLNADRQSPPQPPLIDVAYESEKP